MILFRDCLNETEHTALAALVQSCSLTDGISYSLADDADLYFLMIEENRVQITDAKTDCQSIPKNDSHLRAALCIYHMGDTRDGLGIDELSAFTRPKDRRSGCFRALLAAARPLLRPLLRISVPGDAEALPGFSFISKNKAFPSGCVSATKKPEVLTSVFPSPEADTSYPYAACTSDFAGSCSAAAAHSADFTNKKSGLPAQTAHTHLQNLQTILSHLNAQYDHDEYLMKRKLTAPKTDTKASFSADNRTYAAPRNPAAGQSAAEKAAAPLHLNFTAADGCKLVSCRYGECCLAEWSDGVYLFGMLVYARFRGQGFGTRILAALIAKLSEKGCSRIVLEVSSDNLPALRLYRRMGFQIMESVSYFYLRLQGISGLKNAE